LEPRRIIPDLQYYYEALARVARQARDDPDWRYTWTRLEELTVLVEDVAEASMSLGWDVHRPFIVEGKRLVDAVDVGSHEVMRRIIEIEEEASSVAKKLAVALLYVTTLRQIAGALLLIVGLALLISAPTVPTTIAGILVAGFGLAALILYKTPWSNRLLPVGATIAILAVLASQPGDPILLSTMLAILVTVLAVPLPKALHKLFIEGEG